MANPSGSTGTQTNWPSSNTPMTAEEFEERKMSSKFARREKLLEQEREKMELCQALLISIWKKENYEVWEMFYQVGFFGLQNLLTTEFAYACEEVITRIFPCDPDLILVPRDWQPQDCSFSLPRGWMYSYIIFATEFELHRDSKPTSSDTSTEGIPINFQKRHYARVPKHVRPEKYRRFLRTTSIFSGWRVTERSSISPAEKVDELFRMKLYEGSIEWAQRENAPLCVSLEIVYDALFFFGMAQIKIKRFCRGRILWRYGRLTRLPLELQLKIIESFLSIKDIDDCLRLAFPHLASLYVRTMAIRFQNWLHDLCSRDNMRYLTTQRLHDDRSRPEQTRLFNVYQVRSYDQDPDLCFLPSDHPSSLEPHVPGLQTAEARFLSFMIGAYWWLKRWTHGSSEDPASFAAARERLDYEDARPLFHLVTLDSQLLRREDRTPFESTAPQLEGDMWGHDVIEQREETVYDAVLIEFGELTSICDDMEIFMRPELFLEQYSLSRHGEFQRRQRECLKDEDRVVYCNRADELIDIVCAQVREYEFWETWADVVLMFEAAVSEWEKAEFMHQRHIRMLARHHRANG
ncbi:uncharacterized protein LY89DRAFT_763588 [Mollisia scopiformis]|uniref:Uncharacterized protein n=1 Tax=Mollisia scopiformis TaxID=149040 RepID=A0A132B9Y2_MOLSC|nr:uncharacterized protein LY89DRAFT_763588 [Mollisia scopiformis]KUJ09053.1 hypothetical protein LY89DRAFT_763588 [Mollisia scopiformis]